MTVRYDVEVMDAEKAFRQVRCEHCGRWLFSARGAGDDVLIEIRCTCRRIVTVQLGTPSTKAA